MKKKDNSRSDFAILGTKRLRTENAKLRSEVDRLSKINSRYKQIISNISNSVIAIDMSGDIVDVSSTRRDSHTGHEKMIGNSFWDKYEELNLTEDMIPHPENEEKMTLLYNAAQQKSRKLHQITQNNKTSTQRCIDYFMIKDNNEELICIVTKNITSEIQQNCACLQENNIRKPDTVHEKYTSANKELEKQIAEKNKAISDLKENRMIFTAFFEQSREGILLLDKTGKIQRCNKNAETFLSLNKKQCIGKYLWDIAQTTLANPRQYDDYKDHYKIMIEDIIKSKKNDIFHEEYNFRITHSGTPRYIHTILFPVVVDEEKYIGAILQDKTEIYFYQQEVKDYNEELEALVRKKSQALYENEQKLRTLSDNFPNGFIFRFEKNTETSEIKFTYLSKGFTKITGLDRESVMKDPYILFERMPPDSLNKLAEIDNIKSIDFISTAFLGENNREHNWYHVSGITHPQNNHILVNDGFVMDVTEQMAYREALEFSEHRLKTIVSKLQDMVLVMDANGIISYVTPSCRSIIGYETDDIINQSIFKYIHPEDNQTVNQYINYVQTCNELPECRYRFYKSNGEIAEVKAAIVNMLYDPYVNGLVVTHTDITKQVETQRRMERSLLRHRLLNNILIPLQRTEVIDPVIQNAINQFGKFLNIACISVYEFADDLKIMKCLFDWSENDISIVSKTFMIEDGIISEEVTIDRFWENEIIHITNFNRVSKDVVLLLKRRKIESTLLIPLFVDGGIFGMVSFSVCGKREWKHDEESLFLSFSQILSSALQKQKAAASELAAQRYIARNLERQELLNRILTPLQKAKNMGQNIQKALGEIGRYTNVSRVSVHEISNDMMYWTYSYEWCNTGIEPQIDKFKRHSYDTYRFLFQSLKSGQSFCVYDVEKASPPLNETLMVQGICSILFIPLYMDGILKGCISISECSFKRQWTDDEISLLKGFAQILSNSLQKLKTEISKENALMSMITVLDNTPLHIYVTDVVNNELLFANQRVRKTIHNSIVHSSINDIYGEIPEELQNDRSHDVVAYEHYNPGNNIWLQQNALNFQWIDGRMAHIVTGIDITQRKKMELDLIEAKNKAEESDRLKSAFLANMSHEIRTPMNAIIGFSQLIVEEHSSEEGKQYSGIIKDNCDLLLKLIDDIIELSKIDSNQVDISLTFCDLNIFLDELDVFYKEELQIRKKNEVKFICHKTPQLPVILTDTIILRQILDNLLDNAIKFIDKGHIKVTCDIPDDGYIHFTVSDTGIGIPENKQGIIFERFRQAKDNNIRNLSGTGLGLSISKSLVRLLGGDIHFDSKEGEGTSFHFTVQHQSVE
ncbi:MAG: PAS domain S-box protein [Bacteroidales bacterium]|jgi:PAS domain S-box-containing protein|nr:PAS domain S-box protein [Bacteroidales bacterium]